MNRGSRHQKHPHGKKHKLTDQQINNVQTQLLSNVKMNALGRSPLQQLQLKYRSDDDKDINQLRKILSSHLTYPSTGIADIHVRANRLGTLDVQDKNQQEATQLLNDSQAKVCPCCGFIQQTDTLTFNTDLKKVSHIGISTYLYFLTFKHLIILLTIMLGVFSIYALITNKVASVSYQNNIANKILANSELTYQGYLSISLGSKQLDRTGYSMTTFAVQCWLGVAMLAIWGIFFVYIKTVQRQAQYDVDYDSKTASDYTLLFDNMPKNMKPQQLQTQLRQYQQLMKQYYKSHLIQKQIQVVKINEAIPFYLDKSSFDDKQLQQISKQYDQCKQQFIKLVKQRQDNYQFSKSQAERNQLYQRFKTLKQRKLKRYEQITKNIILEKQESNKQSDTVPAFVTFASSYNKQFLEKVHDRQSYKWFYRLPCFSGVRQFFHFNKNGQRVMAQIENAPEPEDILWTNLGQSSWQMIKKKLITYVVTGCILCISFFIIYGLSIAQLRIKSDPKSHINSVLSMFISLTVSVTNIVVGKILSILTKYERNQTYTHEQTSLGLKAILAVLVNSILIPIIVNKSLKSNIYGVDGLADDVFYLGITNSFLTPVLKIFDFNYVLSRVYRMWYNRPNAKLYLTQNQLCAYSELLQFQIGYEYIYIVNLFLFVCFFVSLQPIIVVFAIVGMLFMFWAQKYCLYNRCKRPIPGNNSINTAMYQLIFLGPTAYTLGSFCWSNFLDNSYTGQLPNIVAAIISGVIFILPYKKIVKSVVNQKPEPDMIFNEDRIFLPSQYDRLNPSTASNGIKDYMNYINDYKKNLAKKNGEQVTYINDTFAKQYGVGVNRRRNLMPSLFNPAYAQASGQDENIIRQLFGGIGHNSMNPFMLGNSLMSDNRYSKFNKQLNIATQNWLTPGQTVTYQNQNQNQPNPFTEIIKRSKLDINDGQTVTYQKPEQNIAGGGDLALNLGNFIRNTTKKGRNSSNNADNQIPLNLPLNLFGNMLNTGYIKSNDNNGWDQ